MHLASLLERLAGKQVLVVGDLMLDEYIWGDATRISPEAPVMVVDADRETHVPGGAANVAHNIVALGGQASVVGVVGSDLAGDDLKQNLEALRIGTSGIVIDPKRRTTRKTRIIAHHQQVLRVDREHRDPVDETCADSLCERLEALIPTSDAIILSDYRKGCLSDSLIERAVALSKTHSKPVTANPKPNSAALYSGATTITLNRVETEALISGSLKDAADVSQKCAQLPELLKVQAVIVTLGEQGMVLIDQKSAEYIPAFRVEVYDTAGAGDSVIAAYTLALTAGASFLQAARLANLAGACVVKHVGVVTAKPEELLALSQTSHYQL